MSRRPAHALVADPCADTEARVRRILDGLSALAGRNLVVDGAVFASEIATAHRNRALPTCCAVTTSSPPTPTRWYTVTPGSARPGSPLATWR